MAHIVNRRGYLSLEESYRDENGKPRKRVLAYFGKRKLAFNIFTDVDWRYTLKGDGRWADLEPEAQKPPAAHPQTHTEPVAQETPAEPAPGDATQSETESAPDGTQAGDVSSR